MENEYLIWRDSKNLCQLIRKVLITDRQWRAYIAYIVYTLETNEPRASVTS